MVQSHHDALGRELLQKLRLRSRTDHQSRNACPEQLAAERDIRSLRKAMCAAQRTVPQKPGAKGGNNHKRIRVSVAGLSGRSAAQVEAILMSPRHH